MNTDKDLQSRAKSVVLCNNVIHLKAKKKYWHHFKNIKCSVLLEEAFIIYTLEASHSRLPTCSPFGMKMN